MHHIILANKTIFFFQFLFGIHTFFSCRALSGTPEQAAVLRYTRSSSWLDPKGLILSLSHSQQPVFWALRWPSPRTHAHPDSPQRTSTAQGPPALGSSTKSA